MIYTHARTLYGAFKDLMHPMQLLIITLRTFSDN